MPDSKPGTDALSRPGREVLLRVTHLSKSFAGTRALHDVSLEVSSSEVLAIVGQNGSGKSTLVKTLAGIHHPDAGGAIEVGNGSGRLVPLGRDGGSLHFIHQDLGLLPMLNTTENLDLGHHLGSRWIRPLRRRFDDARAAELLRPFGVEVDVRAPVATLSPAERAIVAIARALDGWQDPKNVLVLDEPTTAFHRDEVARLFNAVRRVAESGAGIIFISHRLDEVRELADRVVVLRDGKQVAEAEAGSLDNESLVKAIVGSAVVDADRASRPDGPVVLKVDDLRGKLLRGLRLCVRSGEIVGVSGVLGSGREHLNSVLFGAERASGGRVTLGDEQLLFGDMTTSIARGVAFVPADRHRLGAVMSMSMRENLTLPALRDVRGRFGAIDKEAERSEALRWSTRVELRPPEPERALAVFSGGNQQKVVLAKWLRRSPRLLLLDEPTQGVDVGAKASIYQLVQEAAARGSAVLVSSSDAKELASLCHRVVLVQHGQAVGELTGADLTEANLVHADLTDERSAGPPTSPPERCPSDGNH